jgi:glycosyltransferase involved in cell wall biosynthesis
MFSASVIISFYNNIKALDVIITSLESQADALFDVIIADDGSNEQSQQYLADKISSSPLTIKHISQRDQGFRKNRILNKAVSLAESEYLIFIDGDCIPQQHFVADHLNESASGLILNGRRVDLAERYKEQLHQSNTPQTFFYNNLGSILFHYLLGKGKNVEKGLRVTNPKLSGFLNRKDKSIVGCNFSLFKADLLSVNGFNNRYEVASVGEDTDIEYRLVKDGKKVKNLFFKANMLHVIHPELPRLKEATDIFNESVKNGETVAIDGYAQAFEQP